MKLDLYRSPAVGDATPGELDVDGKFECYTIEDIVRDVKIPTVTAIPAGLYQVIITWSPKFGRQMPLLVGVPNFSDIRIHYGNDARDTDGCILVGTQQGATGEGAVVTNSRVAFEHLLPQIEAAIDGGDKVYINVRNEQKA